MEIQYESLKDFTLYQRVALADQVTSKMAPIYTPGEQNDFITEVVQRCQLGTKQPYPAQQEAINALMKGFQTKRGLGLIAEMATGKSLMGSNVSWCMELLLGHATRTLVLCPAILVSTWVKELTVIFGSKVKVVDINGPDALSLLVKLRDEPCVPSKHEVWICGYNRMKTSSPWAPILYKKHSYKKEQVISKDGRRIDRIQKLEIPICPRCYTEHLNLNPKQRNICSCGEILWGNARNKHGEVGKVYAPVNFILKYLRKHFHLLIVDEVHKLKGSDTIQGTVLGQLAQAIPRTLALTGTLSGGKASDIYWLFMRIFLLNYSKKQRAALGPAFRSQTAFTREFGSMERVHTVAPEDKVTGRAARDDYHIQEKPGISPLVLNQFLDCCVFLRINDIADQLPGYEETLEIVDLTEEMAESYREFEHNLMEEMRLAWRNGDMKVVGQFLHTLLCYPDMPQREIEVTNSNFDVVATAPALDIELTPKDERTIERALKAKKEGRKSIIFVQYTGRGAAEYVAERLTEAGLNPLVLKNVPAHKRLEWIEQKMATGLYDCLVTNSGMVETGLNLLMFSTTLYWQTGYNIYTLRQSSRRTWRPGQTQDVEVAYLVYRGTMQERAMTLIASKLEAALILEGELSDKGLVTLANQGENMVGELARALLGESEPGDLETAFNSMKRAENLSNTPYAAMVAQQLQATVTQDPAQELADGEMALEAVSIQLGKRVGSVVGRADAPITRQFTGFKLMLTVMDDGSYEIVITRKNKQTKATWSGGLQDTVIIGAEKLAVLPQQSMPGLVNLSVYQLAA